MQEEASSESSGLDQECEPLFHPPNPSLVLNLEYHRQKILELCRGSLRAKAYMTLALEVIKCYGEGKKAPKAKESLFSFRQWEYADRIVNPTPSPICSKSIGDTLSKKAFRCYDCGEADNAIICYDCFVAGDHKGHSYRQMETESGGCDCGDVEMWKESGFCIRHSAKAVDPSINPQLQQQFCAEIKVLLYCCLHALPGQPIYEEYFQAVVDYLAALTDDSCYDMKILCCQAFNETFQDWPSLLQDHPVNQLNFVQTIFRELLPHTILSRCRKLLFQLSTAQRFKRSILKEYFHKSSRDSFSIDHPLKKINYQFLVFTKLINRMIKQKQLDPLHPNIHNKKHYISCYKRYFEDLGYLSKMTSKEYHESHLSVVSMCDMLHYRTWLMDEDKPLNGPDLFAVKMIGNFVINSLPQGRAAVEKCLAEVGQNIPVFSRSTLSMAHERVFALMTMALCEGDLTKLRKHSFRDRFLSVAWDIHSPKDEGGSVAAFLGDMIKQAMRHMAYVRMHGQAEIMCDYERYYFAVHPEANLLHFLDQIFHKILYLLCQDITPYAPIISQFLEECSHSACTTATVASVLNEMLTSDLDQGVVSGFLGHYGHKTPILYLGRLISAHPNRLNPREFRRLAEKLVNNQDIIEQFMAETMTMSNGKVRIKQPLPLLSTLTNRHRIHSYKLPEQTTFVGLQNEMLVSTVGIERVVSHKIADQLAEACRNCMNQEQSAWLEQIVAQMVILYHFTKSLPLEAQLIALINDPASKNLSNNIRQQLGRMLSRHSMITMEDENSQRVADSKALKLKQKKEERMKRMKEETAKALQQHHSPSIGEQIIDQNQQICVYCKEGISQERAYFISYIGVTDLISKHIIKQQVPVKHMYFKTCGHKVHKQCYQKYQETQQGAFNCFLCKKRTNIIIPHQAMQAQQAEPSKAAQEMLESIEIAMVHQFADHPDQWVIIFSGWKNSLIGMLLGSLAREWTFNGLHNSSFLKLYSEIYISLCNSLKRLNPSILMDSLAIALGLTHQQHPLTNITTYILFKMQHYMLPGVVAAEKCELPPKTIEIIDSFLHHFFTPQKPLSPFSLLDLITPELLFIPFSDNIHALHARIRPCSYCSKTTNWAFYCILCDWDCCTSQSQNFFKHLKEHPEGSVFICPTNGRIAYIHGSSASNKDSLYQNTFGQVYQHLEEYQKRSMLESFRLSRQQLQQIFEVFLNHQIRDLVN